MARCLDREVPNREIIPVRMIIPGLDTVVTVLTCTIQDERMCVELYLCRLKQLSGNGHA